MATQSTGFQTYLHASYYLTGFRAVLAPVTGDEPLQIFSAVTLLADRLGQCAIGDKALQKAVNTSGTCRTSHSREPCMSLLCRRLQERGSNPWSQGYEPCELPTALPCYKTVDVSDTCPTSHPLDPHMSLLWR